MPARFMQVDENLFRGGEPSAADLEMLRDVWGVGKIVSLDGKIAETIHPHCKRLGLQHAIIPIGDGHSPNVKVLQRNLFDIFEMGRDDPEDEKVYVHCLHGKDRTGMAVAMYRIMRGCPADKALQEAYFNGMGRGLSPLTRHSYFQAVRDFVQNHRGDIDAAGRRGGYRDQNAALDAPGVVREQMATSPVSGVSAPVPSGHPMRQSFPPTFERGEYGIGHTTEPLSASAAKTPVVLFRKDTPLGILSGGRYWATTPERALQQAKVEGKDPTTLWQAELKPDATEAQVSARGDFYLVRDVRGLQPPSMVQEAGDVNDAMLQIGQIYQYPGGTVPWGPSSGGGSLPGFEGGDTPTGGGAGSSGFAGVVLPGDSGPTGGGFQA